MSSLNKIALMFFFALCTESSIAQVTCPPAHDNHKLVFVLVFDGLPSGLVDLHPRDGGWDIPSTDYPYPGHIYYLQCKYKDTKETILVKLPKTATVCEIGNWPDVSCR